VQAVLQQTPSAQLFVAHGTFATHAWPCLIEQVPRNEGSLHDPPAGQLAVPQQTPSRQNVDVHCAPVVQVVPVASLAEQWLVASQ
jgi:hypothetical protein